MNMKKRYFYFRASYNLKDAPMRQQSSAMSLCYTYDPEKEEGFFPLAKATKYALELKKDVAKADSMQIGDCIEISKQQFEEFGELCRELSGNNEE